MIRGWLQLTHAWPLAPINAFKGLHFGEEFFHQVSSHMVFLSNLTPGWPCMIFDLVRLAQLWESCCVSLSLTYGRICSRLAVYKMMTQCKRTNRRWGGVPLTNLIPSMHYTLIWSRVLPTGHSQAIWPQIDPADPARPLTPSLHYTSVWASSYYIWWPYGVSKTN